MGFTTDTTDSGTIQVRVAHPDDIRMILNAMQDAGASFLSMDVRKPNLEQVFLKLTGEALDEGAYGEKGAK
jgi:ABC-2 type transport system ATP-binding protein